MAPPTALSYKPTLRFGFSLLFLQELIFQNNMAQRFRSNFIISGSVEVLEEFTWKQIYIGNLCFEVKSLFFNY